MRSLGRNHVFVNCGNPDCYHNAELDVSRFPDHLTYNDLQPRMLCTVCDHRGADVGHRHVERVFDPSRKDKHWGRRKLIDD